ncbi:MAG: LysM peptidoglycan-binding domain-containing protein, partial [Candidatus Krumholzibacteriia bacterium]
MRKNIAVLCLYALVAWGCSSGGGVSRHVNTGRSLDEARQRAAENSRRDGESLGRFQSGVDSAAALFDFGDVADFLTIRDSLAGQLESIAKNYPAIRSEPEFEQVLKSLQALDSLGIVKAYARPGPSVIDSLALSLQSWPEIDSSQVEMSDFAFSDTVFPVISNDRIEFWLRYFTGPGKERFARYLYRLELYRPTVERILTELDLPRELICVPLIESGFSLKARSRARAVGPWQFISGTARIYGLRVNWWYDERRDIVASTYAAGNYLKDLYSIWNSWPLALASYNCGEYRVARAVARHKSTNFWKLRLPKQTERYFPKFLATLYILRDPEKYGFTIPDVPSIQFDEVKIGDATDLKVIAESAGTTMDVLRELNPALHRWSTPPKTEILVKVPAGAGKVCAEKLSAIPPGDRVTWRKHRIRKGETLSVIAGRYGTSISALKQLNGIRNAHRIREGKSLIVPLKGSFSETASSRPTYKTKRRKLNKKALENYAKKYTPPANHKRVVYRVKDRDTLGAIAEVFRTSARKIRRWNDLAYRSYIYPGQKLVIYVPESFEVSKVASTGKAPKPTTTDHVRHKYVVKKGDTFYSISKRFRVSMSDLLAWNDRSTRSTLYPGQT